MGDELLCFVIDRNIKGLELVGEVMQYNNQLAIIFQTQSFSFGAILTFQGIHHNQRILFLCVTELFFLGFKVGKDDFLKQSDIFFIIGPMIWSDGNIKAAKEIILGYTTLSFITIDKLDRSK